MAKKRDIRVLYILLFGCGLLLIFLLILEIVAFLCHVPSNSLVFKLSLFFVAPIAVLLGFIIIAFDFDFDGKKIESDK